MNVVNVGDMEAFIYIAIQRIKDQYLQQWHGNLGLVSILRPSFPGMGISSHRFRVETGRWDRPPVLYAQRKRQIFDIKFEDEFHFMFVCQLYNADRPKLLPRYYWVNPSMQKQTFP